MYKRRIAALYLSASVFLGVIALVSGPVIVGSTAAANQPDFSVEDAELDESTIVVGETATVEATVENIGDAEGEFPAKLIVDGNRVVDTETVQLGSGESTEVILEETFDEAGTYSLSVSDTDAGELTVEEDTEPAVFEVNIAATNSPIIEGDTLSVDVEIENSGDESATQTIDLSAGGLGSDSTTVDLAGGQEVTRTLSIATDEGDAGTYETTVESDDDSDDRTVTVDEQASFEIADTSLSDTDIAEGRSVTVSSTVENVGGRSGTFTAELQVDGDAVATQDVEIAAGSSEEITFSWTFDSTGSYKLSINGEPAGTLLVERPATFEVSDAGLSQRTIVDGDSSEITATVENVGDREGTFTAELTVDGTVVSRQDVTVDGGESASVAFERAFVSAGTYDIGVSGASAGTLTVEQSATFEVTNATVRANPILERESVEIAATVNNTGDRGGTFTAELEVDGDEVDEQDTDIAGGESATITFERTFVSADTYDIAINGVSAGTLTVDQPATFEVTGVGVNESEVLRGEPVEVVATVANIGDREGTFTAELMADDDGVAERNLTIEAGANDSVTFVERFAETGEYALAVGDATVGELTVQQPATFEVRNATLSATTVEEGESVSVTAEVENTGDVSGTFEATLEVDGEAVESSNITVDGGQNRTVEFAREFEADRVIAVSGETAGQLQVEQSSTGGGGGGGGAFVTDSDEEADTPAGSEEPGATDATDGDTDAAGELAVEAVRSVTRVTATVRNAAAGSTATIELERGGPPPADPLTLTALDVKLAADRESFNATVTNPVAVRSDLPAVPSGELVGYVGLTTDLEAEAMEEATLEFRVNETTIAGNGSNEVRIYRHTDRGWKTLETTATSGDGGYRATLSALSPVAIVASDSGGIEVVDATVPADWVQEGYITSVQTTVENPGNSTATRTLVVTVDGQVVASENVTLSPGERQEVDIQFEATGGTVAVDSVEAGTLEVGQSTGADGGESTGADGPGFGLRIVALLLLALAVAGRAVGFVDR